MFSASVYLTNRGPDGRQGFSPDEERTRRLFKRVGQLVECGRLTFLIQPQGDGDAHVGEVVTVTQVWRVVCVSASCAAFGLAPGRPTAIIGPELRRLEVSHAQAAMRLAVDAGGEHNSFLQSLVTFTLNAPPAEGVGKQAGEHGHGREQTDDAVVVDGLAAERHERRFEVEYQVSHGSRRLPVADGVGGP